MECEKCLHQAVCLYKNGPFIECNAFLNNEDMISSLLELGGTIYRKSKENIIYSFIIIAMHIYQEGSIVYEDDAGIQFTIEELGKTFFLNIEDLEEKEKLSETE